MSTRGRHGVVSALALVAAITAVGGGAAAGESSLTGKIWRLTSLGGAKPVAGTTVTLELAQGRVSGSSGCNTYGGSYTASLVRLRVSSLVSTQMACGDAVTTQERKFVQALSSARLYRVRGTTLTLRSGAGRALATFEVQSQALAGTHWKVVQYDNGKQAVVSVVVGTALTAAFGHDGKLSGSAGCNTYTAPYEAAPPKLRIGQPATTRKFCASPEGVMDQEAAYLAALSTVAKYRIVGARLDLLTAAGTTAVALTRG